jgi:murein DD-endopeptidase MepM/ murein hydrolase activator NlpD
MAYSGVPDSGENNIPDKASRYSMDDDGTFVKPMLIELSLAGNFGEPRPHHFHAGLDMRTQHEEGKVVVAAAEGYVERVLVSPTGYGNALFVRHPNGYTTIYAHLSRFAPQIRAAVKKWQYANHSADVDMRLPAHQMPVSQGQFIAFSGNTGGSYGPHLHFEMLLNGTPVNPLNYLS